MNNHLWRRYESAPNDEWVEVCGSTDHNKTKNLHEWYLAIAKYGLKGWIDSNGKLLKKSYAGPPCYWRPLSTFPIDTPMFFDHKEGQRLGREGADKL